MFQKVKNVLKRRKAKLFFLFLLLSGLAWLISNMSLRYQGDTFFDLEFVNPPDSMMLLNASHTQVEVKLDAIGFQFLAFGVGKNKVKIDLSEANRIGSKYIVPPNSLGSQIEKQLSNGVKFVRTNADTLVFEFYGVTSKKVPINPALSLQFAQNYLLDGMLSIKPDSIVIKGPHSEIDTIRYIKTEPLKLVDLNANFTTTSKLKKPSGLKKTVYSNSEVILSGKVSRFSEKLIKVPVSMINLPDNTIAQTFPDEVEVLIKASLADLKKVKVGDIKVIGDYATLENADIKKVLLRIVKQPKTIHTAELKTIHVDFILKRE